MKKLAIKAALLFLLSGSSIAIGQNTTKVGGEEMYPKKDIITNAVKSKDHTTLVAAVKHAGLVKTLQGDGPFTVFAPTNDAFENLPEGTVATLLKPENKKTLTTILTYHVVAGNWDGAVLMKEIKKSKTNSVELSTVSGDKLWVILNGSNLMLKDELGNTSNITIKDVAQSNGVIHVIDAVVMPKS